MTEQARRCLAGIESDLCEAEKAFADADARYIEAENDRRVALERINEYQQEIDEAIKKMRDHSFQGTHWSAKGAAGDAPLELDLQDVVSQESQPRLRDNELTSGETRKSLAREFERLRGKTERGEDNPVLKVVTTPRQYVQCPAPPPTAS